MQGVAGAVPVQTMDNVCNHTKIIQKTFKKLLEIKDQTWLEGASKPKRLPVLASRIPAALLAIFTVINGMEV